MERRSFLGSAAAALCGGVGGAAASDAAHPNNAAGEETRRTKGGYWRLPDVMTREQYEAAVDEMCGDQYPMLRERLKLQLEWPEVYQGNMQLDGAFAALTFPHKKAHFLFTHHLLCHDIESVSPYILLWHGPPLEKFDIPMSSYPFCDPTVKPPPPQLNNFFAYASGVNEALRQLLALEPTRVRERIAEEYARMSGYPDLPHYIESTAARRCSLKIYSQTPTYAEEAVRVHRELLLTA